jgi:acylpyruvate hydrolase
VEVAGRVVDLFAAARRLSGPGAFAEPWEDTTDFLNQGEPALDAALEVEEQLRTGRVDGTDLRQVRLLAPVGRPQKIVCVGQNFRDHCEEQNQPLPASPILFAKYPTALCDPGAPILLPPLSRKVDYEAELCVVIGRQGRFIPEERAYDYVAGYTCLNDVSARDIQKADGQWVRAKSFDTFAPLGPALVTRDEIQDPQSLEIATYLNGERMQHSNTRNLIFTVPYLVSYISQVCTLCPGDLISTGTPGGVGVFRDPPVFLKEGDTVSISIGQVGTLSNPVVAA